MMSKFIVISAGGTGGHMSPAAALAVELKKRGHRVELVTDDRGQKYTNMFPDVPVHVIKSGTAFAGIMGKVKGAINLLRGIMQGFTLIGKLKPDCVIGFGGYPSVPAVFAAQKKGIATGLHEQNAILGKANVFLAPKARFVALSLPSTEDVKEHIKAKMVVTGNPVRGEIVALSEIPYPSMEAGQPIHLFVMGGSLGATIFSQVVPQALAGLSDAQKSRIKIVQQCRAVDMAKAQAIYDDAGMDATLAPFFDDVAGELAKAHLFIGRSGASTVAEVSIAGRPAIYVPYPHHKDQQQKKNAQGVADKGGAWIMSEDQFTVEALQERVQMIFTNAETLSRAAVRAKECGLPDAAQRLADLVLKESTARIE
tara:strand:- start:1929 stop:3032 length:1104 start_codon:yes stop_codon:yes gene_type:complete